MGEPEPDFPPPPPELEDIIQDVQKVNFAEEAPAPPRPPSPSADVVPPRPPPPAEAPMDAQVVEMLQRPPEDNRIAVSAGWVGVHRIFHY